MALPPNYTRTLALLAASHRVTMPFQLPFETLLTTFTEV
jgi:hypothetical protein